MFVKVKIYFVLFSTLIILLIGELFYLTNGEYSQSEIKNKKEFTSIVGLPDLALTTEADYMRHRSLALRSDIFKDGPEHIEYMPTSFVYNRSGYEK